MRHGEDCIQTEGIRNRSRPPTSFVACLRRTRARRAGTRLSPARCSRSAAAGCPFDALIETTGWRKSRLEGALAFLDTQLRGVGARLHRRADRVGIRRTLGTAAVAQVRAVVRRHLARSGLRVTEIRLLRRIHRGTSAKELGNADYVALGRLANPGLIELAPPSGPTSNHVWVLAEEVMFGFAGAQRTDRRARRSDQRPPA